MRTRADHLALRVLGAVLLACGAIALIASLFGLYVINHNAFYTCDAEPRPAGSLPYEAGYAGHGTTIFPVVGVECSWNGTDGGVFTTVIPEPGATATLWSALALCLAGSTLLVIASVRANRPTTS